MFRCTRRIRSTIANFVSDSGSYIPPPPQRETQKDLTNQLSASIATRSSHGKHTHDSRLSQSGGYSSEREKQSVERELEKIRSLVDKGQWRKALEVVSYVMGRLDPQNRSVILNTTDINLFLKIAGKNGVSRVEANGSSGSRLAAEKEADRMLLWMWDRLKQQSTSSSCSLSSSSRSAGQEIYFPISSYNTVLQYLICYENFQAFLFKLLRAGSSGEAPLPSIVTLTIWARKLEGRPIVEKMMLFENVVDGVVGMKVARNGDNKAIEKSGEDKSDPSSSRGHMILLQELNKIRSALEIQIDSGFLLAILHGLEGKDGCETALKIVKTVSNLDGVFNNEVRNAVLHACRASPGVVFRLVGDWSSSRDTRIPDLVTIHSMLSSLCFCSDRRDFDSIAKFFQNQSWSEKIRDDWKRKDLDKTSKDKDKKNMVLIADAVDSLLEIAKNNLGLQFTSRTYMMVFDAYRHAQTPEKALKLYQSMTSTSVSSSSAFSLNGMTGLDKIFGGNVWSSTSWKNVVGRGGASSGSAEALLSSSDKETIELDSQCFNSLLCALMSTSVEGGYEHVKVKTSKCALEHFIKFSEQSKYYYEGRRVFLNTLRCNPALINSVTHRIMLAGIVKYGSEDQALGILKQSDCFQAWVKTVPVPQKVLKEWNRRGGTGLDLDQEIGKKERRVFKTAITKKDGEDVLGRQQKLIASLRNENPTVAIFDLHGYSAGVAPVVVRSALSQCFGDGKTGNVTSLVLIVGKGIHSSEATGFVLGPAVEKYLDQSKSRGMISCWGKLKDKKGEFMGRLVVKGP